MGWTFIPGSRRSSVIEELVQHQNWEREDGSKVLRKCLTKCYKGSSFKGTLYAVFEDTVTAPDGTPDLLASHRWIFVAMMQYSKRDEGWGYKDMDESMGPCESKCPLSYFEMVPCPDNTSARRWRERCRWDREVVALKTSLNKKLRKGEVLRQDAQLQYNEAVRAYHALLAAQDAEFEKELGATSFTSFKKEVVLA
jgi:hypothetical protein